MVETETEQLADLVGAVLADGAQPGFQIARQIEAALNLDLRGREGSLYAALLRLEREGWIESDWRETSQGRRRFYRLPVLREESRRDQGREEVAP